MSNSVIEDGEFLIFPCPHEDCNQYIMVSKKEINCHIFRHGVRKHNFEQINPHSNKDICVNLKSSDSVYGCAKPFKIVKKDNKYYIEICEYI